MGQCNRLLDAVVTMMKYKQIIIYRDIYIKVFSYGTVFYLLVSTDDVLNTTYNKMPFNGLIKVFE